MATRYLFGSTKLNEREKEYLSKKVLKCKRLLSNYSPDELSVEVEVEQDKKSFWRIEVMIKTPHMLFRVDKQEGDFFKAVDSAQDVLTEQIRRHKEKIRDSQRKKGKVARVEI